jgi:hypothetical protein
MPRFIHTLGVALASMLASVAADAATLCVNPGGTGGCFSSVQAAVDVAGRNDIIEIAAGTYAGRVFIEGNDRLTLRGAGSGSTILDMSSVPDTWVFGVIGAGATIEDLAIVNTPPDATAAIYSSVGSLILRRIRIAGGQQTGVSIHEVGGRRSRVEIVESHIEESARAGIVAGQATFVTIRNSTIAENDIGIQAVPRGKVFLEASTVSGNETGVESGGIGDGRGIVNIRNSTITNNEVGLLLATGRARLGGTILAGNSVADCAILGTTPVNRATSQGFNLVGATGDCAFFGQTIRDSFGEDPLLGPLQDNGGPTETHALLPGSPAENRVTRTGWCSEPDQRGIPRSAPCDAGAFEVP